MKKIKNTSIIFIMLLASMSSGVYAEKFVDINIERHRIEQEVREEYESYEEFQKELNDLGKESTESMINHIVDLKLLKLTNSEINPLSGNGSIFLSPVPLIQQINGTYCGPATALQTLSGMGLSRNIAGSTNKEKQQTLAKAMETDPSGTMVYKMKDTLNSYISDSAKYVYKKGTAMTLDQFESTLVSSLMYDRPAILHAKTRHLSYYNNHDSGHYISVDFINTLGPNVNLVDPNYRDSYYGEWEVPLREAYSSISKDRERYLVSLPNVF